MATEWISTREAAIILEVSERLVQSAMQDPDRRRAEWGDEGASWRFKPLSSRRIYQLRRSAVERKAGTARPGDTVQ